MMKTRYDCLRCGGITYSYRVCSYCRRKMALADYQKLITTAPKKKRGVKKLRNCDVCEARKARKQKARGFALSTIKATIASSFQLALSIVVLYYLIQEGVIL